MESESQIPRRGAAFWGKIIAEHPGSGLSIRAYCRQLNLPESSFYFWRQKFGTRSQPRKQNRAESFSGKPKPVRFAAVTVAPPRTAELGEGEMEAVLAGGARLRIGSGVPMDRALLFLRALPC
jgi:hypothetical protein